MNVHEEQELWQQHDPSEPLSVRYRLQQLLDQHEHAEVYRGSFRANNQQVAIKISKERRNFQEMEKFRKHVMMQLQLKHPHLVPILDFGVQSEQAYLIMPYYQAGSLRQKHPRGSRLSLETISLYLKQITDVLTYLHDLGLIHRDIKPHNFLLDDQGNLLLSDMENAAIMAVSTQPSHYFEGTIAYAAPEQLDGHVHPASDQYALGITVYEWIAGIWPFVGDFAQVAEHHFSTPPPPLATHGVHVSSAIEDVIQRALAKQIDQRYPSVQAFSTALLAAMPPPSTSISQPGRQFRTPGSFHS